MSETDRKPPSAERLLLGPLQLLSEIRRNADREDLTRDCTHAISDLERAYIEMTQASEAHGRDQAAQTMPPSDIIEARSQEDHFTNSVREMQWAIRGLGPDDANALLERFVDTVLHGES